MVKPRRATVERTSKETQITVTVDLDNPAATQIETDVPFFTHMLTALATHGQLGLTIQATGDVEVDPHHLLEDTGIVLGQAIAQALDGYQGIQRAGCFAFPMDGSLAVCALDLCGRSNLVWKVSFSPFTLGGIDPNLFREFYKGLCDGMKGTLHVHIPIQDNDHHVIEAVFKAFARSLGQAATPIGSNAVLSTKGMLDT